MKLLGSLAMVVLLATLMCSSPAYDSPECLAELAVTSGSSACSTCEQSSCGSQLDAAEDGCRAYLSCICPNGMPTPGDTEACDMNLSMSACATPLAALVSCLDSACESACS
jgi:hypothetical protein